MFCKYTYKAGAALNEMLSDITLLLTGETNPANLGASCVVAQTSITSSTAAGWTTHDSSTGTSNQTVFKAINADATTYKYMMIDLSSAGYLMMPVYEGWDAGTNTPTNMASGSQTAANSQRVDTTNGGILYIGAAPTYCIIFSYKGATYGSSTGYAPCGIFERTRASGWDTSGAGYPPYVYINFYNLGAATQTSTSLNAFSPRQKGSAGDRTTTAAFLYPSTEFSGGATFRASLPTIRGFDNTLNLKHFMHQVGLVNYTDAFKAGKLLDIYLTTPNYGNACDEITYSGDTYFIMTENTTDGTGSGLRIAIPKF